ncbi:MAG: chromate efflux transporter [Terrimicrobiaceae bacterium]
MTIKTTPTLAEAARFWLRLGVISFGGPAGQIAIMHTELVEKRRWISEERFLHALNFCMVLPGPEAQQLATYTGWMLHGIRGGVMAGALFVLPSALLLWALSWLYMAGGSIPWIAAVFYGLQPAVIALVATAVLRIGSKALKTRFLWALAGLAFVAIFFLKISFLWIILCAAALGWLGGRRGLLPPAKSTDPDEPPAQRIPKRQTLKTAVVCVMLWAAPVVLAGLAFGWNSLFVQQGIFFSKAALVTFGGAYAVLPYVAQQAVENYGWLSTNQMMSGLALAETTPGPLIMVLQFVGFAGAWQNPGTLSPLLAGTLAAGITTWVTFLPSFLFILAGAPHMERLRHAKGFSFALSGITAAVVGVILNLAVWFGLHAFFPAPGKPDYFVMAMSVVFFLGLRKGRWGVIPVVLAGGGAGLLAKLIFGL